MLLNNGADRREWVTVVLLNNGADRNPFTFTPLVVRICQSKKEIITIPFIPHFITNDLPSVLILIITDQNNMIHCVVLTNRSDVYVDA